MATMTPVKQARKIKFIGFDGRNYAVVSSSKPDQPGYRINLDDKFIPQDCFCPDYVHRQRGKKGWCTHLTELFKALFESKVIIARWRSDRQAWLMECYDHGKTLACSPLVFSEADAHSVARGWARKFGINIAYIQRKPAQDIRK